MTTASNLSKALTEVKNKFKALDLFELALTHRSWVNEHPKTRSHNERLEFLGDAVLELIVSKRLYEEFPEENEGFMTNLRANLVNSVNLANLASQLGLGNALHLSRGEEDSGGRSNQSHLANSLEALIGAIYLDQGIDSVEEFINTYLLSEINQKLELPLKDAKTRLQELVQSQGNLAPTYRVLETFGPDHAKEFVIEAHIDGKGMGQGRGKTKAEAEQKAAAVALVKLATTK